MPAVTPALIDALIAAFGAHPGRAGRRADARGPARQSRAAGARAVRARSRALDGDEGARKLLDAAAPDRMIEVDASGPGSILDVDTPLSLAEARRLLEK